MNEADPRVRRTRKLLQTAFMELMSEKRFQDISVQDIAERATLNRATFYAHFADKYALLDYMVGDQFKQELERQIAPDAPVTLENLHLLIVAICTLLAQIDDHCGPTVHDHDLHIKMKVQQELATFLAGWLNHATLASILSWAIFGAGIEWSHGERTVSAEEWARQVMQALSGGVAQVVTPTASARH